MVGTRRLPGARWPLPLPPAVCECCITVIMQHFTARLPASAGRR